MVGWGIKLNNKCYVTCNKKKRRRRKQKTLTLMLLRGIIKTFTGKQAQSGNSGNHFGEKAGTFGQISQVEPSKAVSACTQRRGRKDHLETRNDIRLSVNYSNKHAGEWHLILDVSQWEQWWMPLVQTRSYDIQTLLKTNIAHIAR